MKAPTRWLRIRNFIQKIQWWWQYWTQSRSQPFPTGEIRKIAQIPQKRAIPLIGAGFDIGEYLEARRLERLRLTHLAKEQEVEDELHQ